MTCKNCLAETDGKFCQNCGQKTEIHRVTIPHVAHEFLHAVTHADKGFLLTAKELLTRPGFVAKEYLNGKRKKYFNPLSFLVITAALYAFVTYKAGYYQSFTAGKKVHPVYEQMMRMMVDNNKLFELLILVPLIAFFCFIFFRKNKNNYAENFVLVSYVIGLANLMRIVIAVPLFLVINNVERIDLGFRIVLIIYLLIAFRQFFGEKWIWTILKTALIMPLYIIFYWAAIFGIVTIQNLIFH